MDDNSQPPSRTETRSTTDMGSAPTLPGGSPQAPTQAIEASLAISEGERYILANTFAEGGIGRVLRARDVRLGRWVALKVLRESEEGARRRFLAEALVTARLQHPAIVPVYDAGRLPDGEPFYAMKLVSGRVLSERMAEAKTLSERMALLPHLLAVADAVAYAHEQRIIHRDLKPANVLVGDFGETVVIDWGLAKDLTNQEPEPPPTLPATRMDEPTAQSATLTGLVLGTPAYMPPEQARGEPVDERADVYSLGVMLYQLLCGLLPYGLVGSAEALRKLQANAPLPLYRRQRGIPKELQAIVAKAMDRDPRQRYRSAREFAEDLRRFLTGQFVGAYHYSPWARLLRLLRHYRAVLAVVAVALVIIGVQASLALRRIVSESQRAERERIQAERTRLEATRRADHLTLVLARNAAQNTPYEALECLHGLSDTFNRWGAVRVIASHARAQGLARLLRGHSQSANDVVFSPDGRLLASFSDDRSVRLWDAFSGVQLRMVGSHGDEVWGGRLSLDGRDLVTVGKDGVRSWDLETGDTRFMGRLPGVARSSFISVDARHAFMYGMDGTVLHCEVWSGQCGVLGDSSHGLGAVASSDGKLLARLAGNHRVWLWDVEAGKEHSQRDFPAKVLLVSLSDQRDRMAVSTADGQVWLEDLVKGTRTALMPASQGAGPAASEPFITTSFTPDGSQLVAWSPEGTLWVWDTRTRLLQWKESGPPAVHLAASISSDGRWLALFQGSKASLLWDLRNRRFRELRGSRDRVHGLNFSPDGRWLATASSDGIIRIAPVEDSPSRIFEAHRGPVSGVAFSADGSSLVSLGADGLLRMWSLQGSVLAEQRAHSELVAWTSLSQSGLLLATAGADGALRLWDGTLEELRAWPGAGGRVSVLQLSPDGQWLASGDEEGKVHLWSVHSGESRLLGTHGKPVRSLAFSTDGRRLASGGDGGRVLLWGMQPGQPGEFLHRSQGTIRALAFSPDGHSLAVGSLDHTLWVMDLNRKELEGLRIDVGGAGVLQVAFSPDGRTVLSNSSFDDKVRRWDVYTGKQVQELQGHSEESRHFALSPEGQRLATASNNGTVRLWDLESGEGRELKGHVGQVSYVAFSRDGRYLVSAGRDGTVRLWLDDLPLEPQFLRAWMEEFLGEQPASCNAL